jgi:hypothetical protein
VSIGARCRGIRLIAGSSIRRAAFAEYIPITTLAGANGGDIDAMGPVEEVGKVATSFIGNFKESPTILAFSVFNILFLAFVLWSTMEERSWRERVVEMMVDQQTASSKLLFTCVPFDQIQALIKVFREDDTLDEKKK